MLDCFASCEIREFDCSAISLRCAIFGLVASQLPSFLALPVFLRFVSLLSDPEGPGDEEDRMWPEQMLNFGTMKKGTFICFDFGGLQQIGSSKVCANAEPGLVVTLGDVEFINILSAASLVENGMCMAFTEIQNQK